MFIILKRLLNREGILKVFSRSVDFLKNTFSKILSLSEDVILRLQGKKRSAVLTFFSVISVLSILTGLLFSGARIAYRVRYNGKNIATVNDTKSVDNAVNTAAAIVNGTNVMAALQAPECTTVVTVDNHIDSEEVIVNAILNNTDGIVSATSLYINGKATVCGDGEEIRIVLDEKLHSFDIENTTCYSQFTDSTELVEGYFLATDLTPKEQIATLIDTLNVKTTVVASEDVSIPYKTYTQYSDEHEAGYVEILTDGISGIKRNINSSVYINGNLVENTVVTGVTICEPVDEVKLVGTAAPQVAANSKVVFANGYNFPLPKGTWEVSAYYGDGRGHKGLDLRAPKNTAIMAVSGGKVIFAGWKSGYGYCVEIDHGNGVHTLYGHATTLCVSVGSYVTAGQTIATVGSTGNSTGNHLHLEITINGVNVNPASYIGIR